MNEEILKNIWDILSSEGATDSDFETWKSNFAGDEEVQTNVHTYLTQGGHTDSDLETWSTNVGLKKKDESQSTGEEEVMVSDTEVVEQPGSSEPSDQEIPDPSTQTVPQVEEVPNLETEFQFEQPIPTDIQTEVAGTTGVAPAIEPIIEDESIVTEDVQYDPMERGVDATITYDKDATPFEKSLAYITGDLVEREEEEVINRMNYHFADYGFEFKQKEALGVDVPGDFMTVVADNGEVLEVSLDPFMGLRSEKIAGELKEFLDKNKVVSPEMDALTSEYDQSRKKYFTAVAMNNDIQEVRNQSASLSKRYQNYLAEESQNQAEIDNLLSLPSRNAEQTKEYNNLIAAKKLLAEKKNQLGKDFREFRTYSSQIDKAVGDYTTMKEDDGNKLSTLGKGMYNYFVTRNVPKVISSLWGAGVDGFYGLAQMIDEDFRMDEEEKRERYITIAKDLGYEVPENINDEGVYTSWIEGLNSEKFDRGDNVFPKEIQERLIAEGYDPSKPFLNGQIYKNDGGLIGGGYVDMPTYTRDTSKGEKLKRLVLDAEVKSVKNPQKEAIRGALDWAAAEGVSDEKIAEMSRDSFVYEGLFGLAESGPSILVGFLGKNKRKSVEKTAKLGKKLIQRFKNYITSPGAVAQTMSFSLLQTDALMQEMENDPDFKYVTETEKKAITFPLAITTAVLERYGLRSIARNKSLTTSLMNQITKRLPKGATPKMFTDMANKIISNNVARGVYKFSSRTGKAAAAEFETGALQQVSEIAMKNVWNNMYEKDMFNTPEMWSEEFGDQVLRAGLAESVGGFVMGTPGALISAFEKGDIDNIPEGMVTLFNEIRKDKVTVEAYKAQLDLKVANKEMTKEQATKELLNFGILSSAAETVNTENELTEKQTKDALGLVFLKNKIEGEMEGMDPDLGTYKKKQEILTTIKDRLSKIGTDEEITTKTEDNAIQEPSTETVDVQESTEGSQEVGERDTQGEPTQESIESETDTDTQTQEEVSPEQSAEQIEKLITEEQEDSNTEPQPIPEGQLEVVDEVVSINKAQQEVTEENPFKQGVIERVGKAAKALKKVIPNLKIIMHESATDFNKATGRTGRGALQDGVVHINLEKATNSTVAHEAFHIVLLSKLSTDAEAQRVTKRMMESIAKALPKNDPLLKQINEFTQGYEANIQNEEKLAEILGQLSANYKTLSAPQKGVIGKWIDRIAKALGFNISEFTKSDQDVIDLLNTLASKVTTGVEVEEGDIEIIEKIKEDGDLLNSPPYEGGETLTVNPDGPKKPEPRDQKDIYKDVKFASNLPVITLQDFVNKVKGKLFAVTSDATGLGTDSQGDRIDGGFGYSAITDNLKNGIGFASLNPTFAKMTLSKIAKRFKPGERIGVMIMVQSPNATLGNYYGGKYLGRALGQIKKSNPNEYQVVVEGIRELLENNKSLKKELEKNTDFNSKTILDLVSNPENYTESEFGKEWIKDTNFEIRRILLNSLFINSQDTRTNKQTNPAKLKLKEAGFTMRDFLMEYGDKQLLGENNLKENKGGFVVGGFEMIVPKDIDKALADIDNKGITHPQFNGKLPSTGNNFLFDGLYSIQENFVEYAKKETIISKEQKEDADKAVRKMFKNESFFKPEFLKGPKKVAKKNRGYTHLKSGPKIRFKAENPQFLEEKTPGVTASVAKGLGLSLDKSIPSKKAFKKPATREQKESKPTVEKLANFYAMDNKGFIKPENVYDLDALRQFASRVGYKIKRHRGDSGATTMYSLRDANDRQFVPVKGTARTRFQKIMDKFDDPVNIIKLAREAGYNDKEISYFLKTRKGLKVKEIKDLMEVKVDMFESMPSIFGEIPGGLIAGRKLYEATLKKFNALVSKNSKLPKGKQKSISSLINESIEFMMTLKPYKTATEGVKSKKLASTLQQKLQASMQEALGGNEVKDVSKTINNLKKLIREKIRGAREIRDVKRQLQRAIREIMPKSEYSKGEVMSLLRTIQEAEPAWLKGNLRNLIQQVEEMGAKKNVAILNKAIDKILSKKFEVTVGGKKVVIKIDGDTAKVVAAIKDKLYKADEIQEDIIQEQTKIMESIKELNEKLELTEQEETDLLILNIALGINSSKLMEDNNPRKADQLAQLYNDLKALITIGRNNFKDAAKKRSDRYAANTTEFYKALTNTKEDIDLRDEEVKEKILADIKKRRDSKKSTFGKTKIGMHLNYIKENMAGFLRRGTLGLSQLTSELDKSPGAQFEGFIRDFIYRRVNKSTRIYKENEMALNQLFMEQSEKYLGKEYRKIIKEYKQTKLNFEDPNLSKYLKDPQAVKEAKEKFDNDPTSTNKENYNEVMRQNIPFGDLTPLQLQYLYFQYKQPDTHAGFATSLGENFESIMDGLNKHFEKTYPELLELGQWQVDVLLPSLYEKYNKVYKKIYNTDMPQRDNYSGKTFRLVEGKNGELVPEKNNPLSLFGENGTSQMSMNVIGNSTMLTVKNDNEILPVDAFDAIWSYVRDMEHFHAYAENMNEISKVFNNEIIKKEIIAQHGMEVYKAIRDSLMATAQRGANQSDTTVNFTNRLNSVFIFNKLALGFTVYLKQLTSVITYGNYIGYGNWSKTAATMGPKEWVKTWKEISEDSVYLKYRYYQQISKTIEAYSESSMQEYIPGDQGDRIVRALMFNIKAGDKQAILIGGIPNYVFLKKKYEKTMSPEAAKKKALIMFEEQTKEVQQSSDKQDKDALQNQGGYVQMFNMFMSAPKAYFRQLFGGYRELGRNIKDGSGKGHWAQNARTIALYQFGLPMLFQWVGSGFPIPGDDWDEEDTKDQVRAAMLSVFNSIFVLGQIAESVADYSTGKPWYADMKQFPIFDITKDILKAYDKTNNKDPEKAAAAWRDFVYSVMPLTALGGVPGKFAGAPFPTMEKLAFNIKKIIEGGGTPKEVMLRLFNYSDYVIEGGEKKTKPKGKTLNKTEMRKYFPELMEEQDEFENSPEMKEIKDMQKQMKAQEKAMRKEMLDQLFGDN